MLFGSISSRSFREMVLTQSIMSVFKKDNKNTNTPPESRLTSTTETEHTLNETKIPTAKEEDCGIGPAMTHDTLLSRKEGEFTSYNGKIDPFAGGSEGDVNYKSMKWWYVPTPQSVEYS